MWRAVGAKRTWLMDLLVQYSEALPEHLHVQPLPCHGKVRMRRLAGEAEAMSCFVQKQANTPWIWIALDALTRQVRALHVGDRSRTRAKRL